MTISNIIITVMGGLALFVKLSNTQTMDIALLTVTVLGLINTVVLVIKSK